MVVLVPVLLVEVALLLAVAVAVVALELLPVPVAPLLVDLAVLSVALPWPRLAGRLREELPRALSDSRLVVGWSNSFSNSLNSSSVRYCAPEPSSPMALLSSAGVYRWSATF